MVDFIPEDKHIFARKPDGAYERKIFSEPFKLQDSDYEHYKKFNAHMA
jgi:hypothetical protein